MADFGVRSHYTLYSIDIFTQRCMDWVRHNVQDCEEYDTPPAELIVDHRNIKPVVDGMLEDGLVIGTD